MLANRPCQMRSSRATSETVPRCSFAVLWATNTTSTHATPGDAQQGLIFQQAFGHFLTYYRAHKLDHTRMYPGVLEALQEIRRANPSLPMAILTNKPVAPSRVICAELGLAPFFFANYGGNSFATKKPDPEGLRALIAEANALQPAARAITPAETVMIGDSDVDVRTARACGARSLGCTYGLAPEALAASVPDAVVDSAASWPAALGFGQLLFPDSQESPDHD